MRTIAARLAAIALLIAAALPARAAPTLDLVRFPAAEDGLMLDALCFTPEKPTKSLLLLIPGLTGAVMGGGLLFRICRVIFPPLERLQDLLDKRLRVLMRYPLIRS